MKDIPVFTTKYGVASLVLKEIPYCKQAHIKLISTQEPENLLEECIGFCCACGAEYISAAGDACLEKYPLVTEMWMMTCPRERIPEADACLFPMTEETVERWLSIYNERMADVPNAAYLDRKDGKEFLECGDCYFVHKDGKLLGIGKAAEDYVDVITSVEPGMGETVMRALCSLLTGDMVRVVVASENKRAVGLYERMGFLKTQVVSKWYRIR